MAIKPRAKRSMRVGCVIHSIDGGGAERVMAGLASRLAHRGHAITLITLDDGKRDRHFVDGRVSRRCLDVMSTAERSVSTWRRIRRLRATLCRDEFDVVLSFCDANNLLVLVSTLGLANAPPIVVSERSDPAFQTLGRIREMIRNRLYRKAAKVVCLSEDVAGTLRRRTGTTPLVIPSAVDRIAVGPMTVDSKAEHAPARSEAPLRLVAVGRLEPEKGFDRLLRAMASVDRHENLPDWRLEILGDGGERTRLESLARELKLHDRVEFRGWVRPIDPILVESDVFVLPSRYEGFPSAMLEAMSSGTSVVAVDAGGGVRDAIEHGVNGWLVPNDDEALIDGIEHVMTHESLRHSMANEAKKISQRFSWSAMVESYERVLEDAAIPDRDKIGAAK